MRQHEILQGGGANNLRKGVTMTSSSADQKKKIMVSGVYGGSGSFGIENINDYMQKFRKKAVS